jgi:hypothetical protein
MQRTCGGQYASLGADVRHDMHSELGLDAESYFPLNFLGSRTARFRTP